MNILLVEPSYKNKYPPMSLMKISTYHKNRGDLVYFAKGIIKSKKHWDRIYITTLFTFYYKDVIKTINYYKKFVDSEDHIFVGGIMASLLVDDLKQDSGLNNIIKGRLIDSSLLGFNDHINIDSLPLDYDILHDSDYEYPAGDNFFAYTTRGCVNRCVFCAVPELEGSLNITNNITEQISTARETYNDKRNILLMDNNILGISICDLKKIVEDLNSLGFIKEPNFYKTSNFTKLYDTYHRYIDQNKETTNITQKLAHTLDSLLDKNISNKYREIINDKLTYVGSMYENQIQMILENIDLLSDIEKFYNYKKPMQRYVDFNQGMDARLLTEEKMKIISNLPIRPFRIAFDDIKYTSIYTKAIRLAAQYGVKEFSNYLLYNFDDFPIDLYKRIKINIELAKELNVHIYSFPMKFEPIENKIRSHVGINWNNYYLRSIKAILNVSKGVFGGETGFFERAFGRDPKEFFEIISMPKDIITYREYYEGIGITQKWREDFYKLTNFETNELLKLISNDITTCENENLNHVLRYYKQENLDKKRGILKI